MSSPKKIIILALSLFLMPLSVFAQGVSNAQQVRVDALSRFYEANAAYKQSNYQKAIEGYEKIIRTGTVSGPIYYNMGNSYFKAGELGAALLNYERAKRFIPRDSDLEANYQYAQASVKKYEGAPGNTGLNRIYSQYREYFTLDEITILLFCLLVLMSAVYLAGLFWKWPSRRSVYLLTVLGLFFLLNAAVFQSQWQEYKSTAIILKDTPAKFEPREEATTHFELSQGLKVNFLNEDDGWVKIRRQDGKIGWVKKQVVEKI